MLSSRARLDPNVVTSSQSSKPVVHHSQLESLFKYTSLGLGTCINLVGVLNTSKDWLSQSITGPSTL
jgi:hypothetical protein